MVRNVEYIMFLVPPRLRLFITKPAMTATTMMQMTTPATIPAVWLQAHHGRSGRKPGGEQWDGGGNCMQLLVREHDACVGIQGLGDGVNC